MKTLHVKFSKTKYHKTLINQNSKKFYRKHPKLTPRNVYLELSNINSQKQIRKTLDGFYKQLDRNTLKVKIVNSFKQIAQKVKQFFNFSK